MKMFPLQTHLKMLDDRVRMDAYQKAVSKTVRDGDVVADIGTGSGVLAFLAIQAGARKVYAIESGPIIDVAKKAAVENGFSDRICFIQGTSKQIDIPEKVDAIVTETIGCFGIDEGIIDIIGDARQRFLKSGGKIIPQQVALLAAPVAFKQKHPFRFLEGSYYDIQFAHLRRLAANTVYSLNTASFDDLQLLSPPDLIFEANLYECGSLEYPVEMTGKYRIAKKERFDGIVVFPEIMLTDGIGVSLFKDGRSIPSHWELTFFPNKERYTLVGDDMITFKVTLTEHNGFIWENHIRQNGKTDVFRHLSLFGSPSLSHLK